MRMETVGKFEFSRKDLIGHGAFAVVFKGRNREKHDWEVAVKCINKKNLAKSQTLLGKEIKILKELKHENIVALLDFQVCNSTPTSDITACTPSLLTIYLHPPSLSAAKGTLSEDTIRVFLQQIAGAMRVLQAKGIIHRDLKPQNILLSYPPGRKSHSNNTCIKIADFGFARYLQNNMMAATLCGSPMYMAPEVIMSQNYDAKADLWSIGTIVFQCLTGKAPFQHTLIVILLVCSIPRETSSHLRHLLLGLLQRNHKDRMDFGYVICAPHLFSLDENYCTSLAGLSITEHLFSKIFGVPVECVRPLCVHTLTLRLALCVLLAVVGRPSEFPGGSYGNHGQSLPIPVPTQLQNYQRMEQNLHSTKQDGSPRLSTPVRRCSSGSLLGFARTGPSPPYGQGAVTPNRRLSLGGARPFQLSPQGSSGSYLPAHSRYRSPHHAEARPASHQHPQATGLGTRLHSAPCLLECASGGVRQKIRKQHSDPVVAPSTGLMTVRPLHSSPRLSELMQRSPLPTILGSPSRTIPPFEFPKPPSSPNLVTFLTQQGLVIGSPCSRTAPAEPREPGQQAPTQVTQPAHCIHRRSDDTKGFGRSQSAGRLSDMLLMAAFGPGGPAGERGSTENLTSEKAIDITVIALFCTLVPPSGGGGLAPGSCSPAQVVFTVGSPPSGSTPPHTSRQRKYSGSFTSVSPAGSFTSRYPQTGIYLDGFEASSSPRYSFTDPITANMGGPVTFEAPELPEETLMEQEHTDTVQRLRFTLDFARCLMEVAGARGAAVMGEQGEISHPSVLQPQSLVADQISSLSREWSHAEQLVLYLKTAELLSTALRTAMERVKQGKLYPSATVKQVVRRLNELYKSSVASCRSLSTRLERFFSRKHRLMDQITSITAERLLFSHTVQMVQAAALDEMFHQGEASALRYHKALLLMEGLSLLLTEQDDIVSVGKCKECIERRLTALQSGLCV
uniref:non-specific serine/threonine protein kinase n=1 Tax=Sparus aurata TaxID=8175 RepID=A0A671X9S4_SPAAU